MEKTIGVINTQNKAVLNVLLNGQEITPQDAMDRFGCYRLGARIHDLRAMGYPIITETRTSKNRYGRTVQYASYRMDFNRLEEPQVG